MNQFEEKFKERIREFDYMSDDEVLLNDILHYANSNPAKFVSEFNDVRFNREIDYVPLVLEALSKDTNRWGDFFVNQLNDIFQAASGTDKPQAILSYLSEFAYIEEDTKPYIQRIADRFFKEIDSPVLEIQCKAIWYLPAYIENPVVRNKNMMLAAVQEKLRHKDWNVRYVAHKILGIHKMYPDSYRRKLIDKILPMVLPKPGY